MATSTECAFETTPSGRRIAYCKTDGAGPGVVFLGGFMSDMQGTKALFVENWCRERGRAFLRFDYSGHGRSCGAFTDGCVGDWAEDAEAVIAAVTGGPQVLVGSSMGGWISLLLARKRPDLVAGFVGIAAAPDFTARMWDGFSPAQRQELRGHGVTMRPSDYDDPYPITQRLIEDGRAQFVMNGPLRLPFPVRLLQGTDDADVPQGDALALLAHADCADIRLTLVRHADHRFSDPACLRLVADSVQDILEGTDA